MISYTAAAIVAVSIGLRLHALREKAFDPDEFLHVHAAWLIHSGATPYLDYFDHHAPLFHFLLAPLFTGFDVGHDVADAVAFLRAARAVAWGLTIAALALTFFAGRRWRGTATAWLALALLETSPMFLRLTLEIRPDTLAVGLMLVSLVILLGSGAGRAPEPARALAAGVPLGLALLSTPKMAFAAFGIMVGILLSGADRWRTTRAAMWVGLGTALPLASAVLVLWLEGALEAAYEHVILFNLRFEQGLSGARLFGVLLAGSPLLGAFGAMGAARALARARSATRGDGDLLLTCVLLFSVAGVVVMPVPYEQYLLPLLPPLALLAAEPLRALARPLPAAPRVLHAHRATILLLAALPAIVALSSRLPRAALWAVACGAALLAIRVRRPHAAVGVLLIAASVLPLRLLARDFFQSNAAQLRELLYVLETTGPDEAVLDAYSGYGVFRPHAVPMFFLPREVRGVLTAEERRNITELVRRRPPQLVIMAGLEDLHPPLTTYVRAHYAPTGVGSIWQRIGEDPPPRPAELGPNDRPATLPTR